MRLEFLLLVLSLPSAAASGGQPTFGFDDLRELVEARAPQRVEEVLSLLPAQMRSGYTLVYRSRSLQGASPEYPRVILFGRDARLVLALSGDASSPRHDEIELLYVDDRDQEFVLRTLRFVEGAALFSRPNPAVCLGCHGAAPRPLWHSYDYERRDSRHWEGVFGSTHDMPRLDALEHAALERFRRSAREHERYRHLLLDSTGSAVYPYTDGSSEHRFRPNNRLGNLLARHNAARIAHHLQRRDFFVSHPATGLLWLLNCPQALDARFRQRIAQRFAAAFEPDAHQSLYAALERVAAANKLAFEMEKLLSGLQVYTWDLRLRPPPDGERYSTGRLSMDELVAARVFADVAQRLVWLQPFYKPWRTREVYDAFAGGYYERNLAPGGVGDTYDSLGMHFDPVAAARACAPLSAAADAELSGADGAAVPMPAATSAQRR